MKGKWTLLGSILAVLLLALAVGLARAQGPEPPGEGVPPQGGMGIQALMGTAPSAALGTGFTYQGQLKKAGNPVNGTCDFQFSLWDAASGGTQVGIQTTTGITVTNGLFTVQLDFGAGAFQGDARWLQIAVKCAEDTSYTTLTPRQPLTPAPYALFSMKGTSYQNVVIVAKSGGDFTSIQAALDSITDASADNRYLVWVAPGTYNERVTMKPYVDIEGAGELVTKITYSGSTVLNSGTVIGANDAELRHLTVENTGAATYAIAIYNASASPRLTQLTVIAQGGTFNFGIYNYSSATPKLTNVTVTATGGNYTYGMYNSSSSPVLVNVVINATGATNNRGVYNDSGAPTLTNVTIEAGGGTDSRGMYNFNASPGIYSSVIKTTTGSNTYGIYNYTTSTASSILINNSQISGSHYGLYSTGFGSYTSTVLVNNSQVSGSTHTIYNGTNAVTRIGASQLSGGAVSVGGGTVTCAGVYDENYAFYASTCP